MIRLIVLVCFLWGGIVNAATTSLSVDGVPSAVNNFPISNGVVFAKGVLTNLANLRLDKGGSEIAAQFDSIATWPDGSYKSVLVTFVDNLTSGSNTYTLNYGSGVSRSAISSPLDIANMSDRYEVTNGTIVLTMRKSSPNIISGLTIGGSSVITGGEITLADTISGKTYTLTNDTSSVLSVERSGGVYASFLTTADMTSSDSAKVTKAYIRLHVYKGSPIIRVQYSMSDTTAIHEQSYASGSLAKVFDINNLRMDFSLGFTATNYAYGNASNTPVTGSVPIAVNQDASVSYSSGNYTYDFACKINGTETGDTAAGWLVADNSTLYAGGWIKNFWKNFPNELYASSSALSFRFQPVTSTNTFYSLFPGVGKTFETYLFFGSGSAPTSANYSAALDTIPFLAATPAWNTASLAFGHLTPRVSATTSYDARVDRTYTVYDDESQTYATGHRFFNFLYGKRDFGDYVQGTSTPTFPMYGNNHYEDGRGRLVEFVRTSDKKWFKTADKQVWHTVDIDIMHAPMLDGNSNYWVYKGPGLVHWHNDTQHEGGYTHLGHTQISGAPFYYLLTGDMRVKSVIEDVGTFYSENAEEGIFDFAAGKLFEEQRTHSWPLHTLLDIWEATGHADSLVGANVIMMNLIDWWKNAPNNVLVSADGSSIVVNDTMDWQNGWSAWITNMRTDNCSDSRNRTVQSWMALELIWVGSRYYDTVHRELDGAYPSLAGTYLSAKTFDNSQIKKMLWDNAKFVVDKMFEDTDYNTPYAWIAPYNTKQFAYTVCPDTFSASVEGNQYALPALSYILKIPGVASADATKWGEVEGKMKTVYLTNQTSDPDWGYNGQTLLWGVPYTFAHDLLTITEGTGGGGSGLTNTPITRKAGNTAVTRKAGNTAVTIK
jgi:hypothetical protein